MFDTQITYSDSTRLVPNELRNAITTPREHLTLTWWVPDVVWLERRRQMILSLQRALPYAPQFELLTGQGMKRYGSDEIASAVDRQMATEAQELGLRRFVPSYGTADWASIITNAVDGEPPFERRKDSNEKEAEKGFRDRMVGEAFLQVAAELARNREPSLLFLVCADNALRSFIENSGVVGERVRLLASRNELNAALNSLNLEQRGVLMLEFRGVAARLFYTEGDERSLFYAGDLPGTIAREHSAVLEDIPAGATRTPRGYEVKEPVPEDLENGEMVWSSKVGVLAELARRTLAPRVVAEVKAFSTVAPSLRASEIQGSLDRYSSATPAEGIWLQTTTGEVIPAGLKNASATGYRSDFAVWAERVETAVVEDLFEVRWSARIDGSELRDPRRGAIRYVGRTGGFP